MSVQVSDSAFVIVAIGECACGENSKNLNCECSQLFIVYKRTITTIDVNVC